MTDRQVQALLPTMAESFGSTNACRSAPAPRSRPIRDFRCDQGLLGDVREGHHIVELCVGVDPMREPDGYLDDLREGQDAMKLRILLALAMAVLVAGCFAGPSPPTNAPPFPGHPAIPNYSGSQCKTVLLIGASLMTPVSNVAAVLHQSGRCANVINAAVNGSAPTGTLQGVDWSSHLRGLIGQYHPDIVVIEVIGNGVGTGD